MLPVLQLDNKGLFTYSNLLSQVPPGAMTIAQNVVIDRPGIAETRRGFDFYGTALTSYAIKGFVYNNTLLWYCHGGQLAYDSDGVGTWINYSGSFFPPTNNFVNSTQASGNFYFTTNNGVYKLDSVTGTPRRAGGPQALDVTTTLLATGTGTAILNNSQVAYAVVWGYTDANSNLILGAPSEWSYVVNSSGSPQNITVTTTIPAEVTTSYFVQIYRTAGTTSSSIPPGNTFQLADQYTPNSTDIANKYVTITDVTPDALLGAYLYTADGQPANLPNTPPPLCLDICTYNGMTFYLNYSTIQQANITLDGVGAPNGLVANDTLTITDTNSSTVYVYTAKAANNFPSRQFAVVTSGTIAQQIDATARNLVSAINQDPNNTFWYAYYQTGTNVLPGAIILKARNLQTGTFYLNASRTTCWTPVIPSSTNAYISGNFALPGGFMTSKVNQPEAVPVAYSTPVQSGNLSIVLYRGLALQDALYLFTNGGVFRVSGTDPSSLQVILFDSSALLVGLQTPEILNNSIYYNSTQAVCNVSSGGNQIVSRNVERDILQLAVLTNFSSLAYGLAYESDRKYSLFSPTTSVDLIPTQSYVYNWITTAWTQWTRPASAAIVNQANQHLFIADGSGNVFKERKNFSNTDYADESYTITINTISSLNTTFTLASSLNVSIGDIIQQTVSGVQYSTQVTGNDTGTGIINVTTVTGFTTATATSYKSIAQKIKYAPLTCGFGEYLKRYNYWQFAFSNANFMDITATFTTDMYLLPETSTLTPKFASGWGAEPLGFGTIPFGVSTIPEQVIPCYGTQNTSIARWVIVELDLTEAFTSLALDGIMCTFDIISPRGR
jgi:hypothetical protein